jgi:hypothetical protein
MCPAKKFVAHPWGRQCLLAGTRWCYGRSMTQPTIFVLHRTMRLWLPACSKARRAQGAPGQRAGSQRPPPTAATAMTTAGRSSRRRPRHWTAARAVWSAPAAAPQPRIPTDPVKHTCSSVTHSNKYTTRPDSLAPQTHHPHTCGLVLKPAPDPVLRWQAAWQQRSPRPMLARRALCAEGWQAQLQARCSTGSRTSSAPAAAS